MDKWRRDWFRNGIALIGGGFVAWAARLGSSYDARHWYQDANWWVIVAGAVGAWMILATLTPLWFPTKTGARRPDCILDIDTEYVADAVRDDIPGEGPFRGCTLVFLILTATRDTGTFSVQFDNISGLATPEGVSLDKHVGSVAWENTTDFRQIVGPGNRSRLILMRLWEDPVRGWFQLPFVEAWGRGTGPRHLTDWRLIHKGSGTRVSCDVIVTNETKHASGRWRVDLDWRRNGRVDESPRIRPLPQPLGAPKLLKSPRAHIKAFFQRLADRA